MLRLWALLATSCLIATAQQDAAAEVGDRGEVALATQRKLALLEEAGEVPRPVSLEEAEDARKPLSDEDVAKTIEAQDSLSPQITQLENQHDNLTYLVRLQAQAVANESNTLAKLKYVQSGKRWQVSKLAADYEQASSTADLAETAYQTHLAAIAVAKQKRDELKSRTDEARKMFEELAPQYHAAEHQLNVLTSQTPLLANRANATSDEETRKGSILKDATDQTKGVTANMSSAKFRLEAAMKRLNQLHANLADVEAKFADQKNSAPRLNPLSAIATLVVAAASAVMSSG